MQVEVAELHNEDAGEFYGSLLKAGFKTARFSDIYNFTMRRDNFRVSLVGGQLDIKEVKDYE